MILPLGHTGAGTTGGLGVGHGGGVGLKSAGILFVIVVKYELIVAWHVTE